MLNFPAIIKTTDILSPADLVTEIRNGNLIEAQLPNGILTLSQEGNFLFFNGTTTTGEKDKRALMIHSKTDWQIQEWISNLIPVESEEDRIDRLRCEQENELRAASLEEDGDVSDSEMYDEDAAFNNFYLN